MATKKQPTIAGLVRTATHSKKQYIENMTQLYTEGDLDRVIEFYTRLSLPRSWSDTEAPTDVEIPEEADAAIWDFATEMRLAAGITKFVQRNLRKIKWHVSHPSVEGADSVALLFDATGDNAAFRIRRIINLMQDKEVLSAVEWGQARELLNGCYRDYRSTMALVTGKWLESLLESTDRAEALARLEGYPQLLRKHTETLQGLRENIEKVRVDRSVQPDGYPLVTPPRYFGGDLLDDNSWKHFWGEVGTMSDQIRQHVSPV